MGITVCPIVLCVEKCVCVPGEQSGREGESGGRLREANAVRWEERGQEGARGNAAFGA